MIIGDSVPWLLLNEYKLLAESSFYGWKIIKGTHNSCPTILRETN